MKSKPLPEAPLGDVAGTEEALDFVRGLQKRRRDKAAVEKYIDEFPLGTLQGFARRIMMDVLKAPRGGTEASPAPEETGRAEPRRTTARPRSTARRRPAREP
jgi:hypothetical protein